MANEVVKSQWHNVGSFITPAKLLSSLGIPFKHKQGFWLSNEGELEYIFYDFQKRARELKAELHPDAPTGNDEFFRKFNADCERVTRMFAIRGVGGRIALPKAEDRKEIAQNYHNTKPQRPVGQRECLLKTCQQTFIQKYSRQRYCCKAHQVKARNQRAYRKRRAFIKKYDRRCLYCGRRFVTTHRCKTNCSESCTRAAASKAWRDRNAVPLPEYFRTCPWCSKNFYTTTERKVYCCRRCKSFGNHEKHRQQQALQQAA